MGRDPIQNWSGCETRLVVSFYIRTPLGRIRSSAVHTGPVWIGPKKEQIQNGSAPVCTMPKAFSFPFLEELYYCTIALCKIKRDISLCVRNGKIENEHFVGFLGVYDRGLLLFHYFLELT